MCPTGMHSRSGRASWGFLLQRGKLAQPKIESKAHVNCGSPHGRGCGKTLPQRYLHETRDDEEFSLEWMTFKSQKTARSIVGNEAEEAKQKELGG